MLDINLFRKHPEIIRESQRRRFADVGLVDEVVQLDKQWRRSQFELDNLRNASNNINDEFHRLKELGEDTSQIKNDKAEKKKIIEKKKADIKEIEADLGSKLETIGNLVHDSVPVSNNEANNVIVRSWGEKRTEKGLKNHVDLIEALGIADMTKGADVAGGRGYYLKGAGVLLNQALIMFALGFMVERGYTLLQPSFFIRKDIMAKCAQ